MRLNDEYDDYNTSRGKSVSVAGIISILAIVTILGIVLLKNTSAKKGANTSASTSPVSEVSSVGTSVSSFASAYKDSNITVSDLDFYDMYPKEEPEVASAMTSDEKEELEKENVDESEDGKHTKIVWQDGTEEWVAISPYLPTHDYDFTNLINRSGIMEYWENDKVTSYFGVDISKDNDYIDFNKVAKAGVSFVMIRVGARGYQTGQLSIDEYFTDNIKRATDAGLKVGVYFISQAINEEEALEEAMLVTSCIENYDVDYPICYVMQLTENEVSRVEILNRQDKTIIARTFLNYIKESGYKPMLYGSKLWLLKYVELSKLIGDFDIWLGEPSMDIPDFPYKFAMWQYNSVGSVDGIKGPVNLNISFTDFSLK